MFAVASATVGAIGALFANDFYHALEAKLLARSFLADDPTVMVDTRVRRRQKVAVKADSLHLRVHSRNRRNGRAGWNAHRFAVGFALRAKVFDNPFEARHGLRNGSLHQLFLRVDLSTISGNSVGPHELFWLNTRGLRIAALIAHHFAVAAAWLTGTGKAEVFTHTSPASRRDLLVFNHESTNFLTSFRFSTMKAEAVSSACSTGDRDDYRQRKKRSNNDSEMMTSHQSAPLWKWRCTKCCRRRRAD